jgi:hypothetical protein
MKRILNMRLKAPGLILLTLLMVSLSSCLTIMTGLDHSSSGAGRLSLDYRINKKAAGVQKDSVTSENLIPLPVKRSDFDELAALYPTVTIRTYSEREDTEFIYIETELEYQDINDLSLFLGFPIEFSTAGNLSILTMHIFDGNGPLDRETLSIIDSLFSEDKLSFELTFPRALQSSNYGSINGRTVNFDISIPDVYRQNSLIWTVEW